MQTFNIYEAKTNLSRLVKQAAKGESFVIAKAGKPLVKVTVLDSPVGGQVRRLGFLTGQISVPADFDRMGSEEIARLFGGDDGLLDTHLLLWAAGAPDDRADICRAILLSPTMPYGLLSPQNLNQQQL